MRLQANRSGFTLIELLITIVIVGILATIAYVNLVGVNEEAYRTVLEADLKALALEQELYHVKNMTYGELADLTTFEPSGGVTVTVSHADGSGLAMTATHAALEDVVCGYFIGDVPDGAADPAEEAGATVCD